MNNIFGRIKSLVSNIRKLKNEFDEIIRKNSDYLACGTYKVAPSLKMAYNKKYSKLFLEEDKNCWIAVFNKFDQVDGTTKALRKLTNLLYLLKKPSKHQLFYGDAILISSKGNMLRFIDLNKSTVCTKYNSKTIYENVLQKRNAWGKYFNVVPVIEKSSDNLYTIEKYLIRQPIKAESELLIIINGLINVAAKLPRIVNSFVGNDAYALKDFCERLNIQGLYYRLLEIMKGDCNLHTLTHGDLTFLNVIFHDNELYYIDFENVCNRVFFYDVFFFICFHYLYDDSSLIDNYLSGNYDDKFTLLFKLFGLEFNPHNRAFYVICFLYYNQRGDFLDERLINRLTNSII